MKKYTFSELKEYAGLPQLSEELNSLYIQWENSNHQLPLLNLSFLHEVAQRFMLPTEKENIIINAVTEIETDDKLLRLSLFLRDDMCAARHRCDLDDYNAMVPTKLEYKDFFSFVLLLSCVEPSMQRLEKAGVPLAQYENIPFTPMKEQMKKLALTGVGTVADFPWDMNFYTCSIFRIDRFYFIPFKFDDEIKVYRHKINGDVIAFYVGNLKVRRDGQFNGVDGVCDKDAYMCKFDDSSDKIVGFAINPHGIIENTKQSIDKASYDLVLQQGDLLLGTHIPSGEGYTPQRLKTSLIQAHDFFSKYFPEIPVRGFGSESWLYDPHMKLLLKPTSNILSMQRQMYLYPMESGDGMMWTELFGGKKPINKLNGSTSLEKSAITFIENGGHFAATGMFILNEDIDKICSEVYSKDLDLDAAIARIKLHCEVQ